MRYAIFSDIHSNLEAFDTVIEAYKKEGIDQYLCIGDVVGYAANPRDCVDKVKTLVSVTVAGNHDHACVNLFSADYFNEVAKEAIIWTQRNVDMPDRHFLEGLQLVYKNDDFTIVHGTLDEPGSFNYMLDGYTALKTFELLENNICFVGHTHVPGAFIESKDGELRYQEGVNFNIEEDKKYIINVGSVGQPRDGDPRAAYCIFDTDKKNVRVKRIGYDIDSARNKIIKEGLPRFLGDRLLAGR